MSDFSFQSEVDKDVGDSHFSEGEKDLFELRRLLMGSLEDRVNNLHEKIDNAELQPEDVSRVLPEAIKHRATIDDKVGKALESSIAAAIRTSINKDRKIFADVLFPILGPAIRKAIASVILGMLQSFNNVLEQSLSFEGIKWRIEAFRTKRPFAEVVLLKTLLFQVEQIFLIHKNTGLVLQHVVAKEVAAQDPDLVSSMLTAIQDFVHDSFSNKKDDNLDTLRMGLDRSVWIERGANAILAVVIRGTPPLDLRSEFRDVIDDINQQETEVLESFQGDTTPFEVVRPRLDSCLKYQTREAKKNFSPWLWVSLFSVGFLIVFLSVFFIKEHQKWVYFLERLKKEPGIVITNIEKHSGIYHIYGLRDVATDLSGVLINSGINNEKIIFYWEPYHSLYPEFLLKRVNKILQPAETTTLSLKNNVLYAHGTASHNWIFETRNLVRVIPGIEDYQDDKLIDIDQTALNIIRKKIEDQKIYFDFKDTLLTADSMEELAKLNLTIDKFFQFSKRVNNEKNVEIIGHTDSVGKDKTNMRISQKRADAVLAFLISAGHKSWLFTTKSVGSNDPQQEEIKDEDRAFNRCVSFRIIDHK